MLCGLSSTGGSLFQALENRIKNEFLKAFPGRLSKFLFLSLAWKATRLPAPSLPCTEGEVGQSDGSLLRVKQADFQASCSDASLIGNDREEREKEEHKDEV